MRQRRTKIICTLSDTASSVEIIKELVLAGMNVIRLNLAFCDAKTMEIIMKNKTITEKEMNVFIPVIADLKGSTMRLGVIPDGEVHLKKGDEFRISTNKKIIGDKNIVACDCEELGKLVSEGDLILVDYGRVGFRIKKVEAESESLTKLRERYPSKYSFGFTKKHKGGLKNELAGGGDSMSGVSEEEETPKQNTSDDSEPTFTTSGKADSESDDGPKKKEVSTRKSKFNAAFKSQKKKGDKDVLLCEVESDCVLISSKALFVMKESGKPVTGSMSIIREKDNIDDDDEDSCITVKDVKDINNAIKYGIDCIAISGVHSARDINDARFILGKTSQIRIIAKIQDAKGLEKFDEILQAADGIMISRGYLTVHTPVEKLYFKQKEMIRKCHEIGKPVIIVG